jgi:DedD protein
MADPADLNVDEMRRRARRRLVGAIVLALAAAVIVPMLLESDPKPLGESIAVKIPPVDDGKFVNRLSDGTASKPVDAGASKPDAAPKEGRRSVIDAEKAVVSPPGKAPKYDTQIAGEKTTAAPVAPSPAKPAVPAEAKDAAPKVEPRPDAKSEPGSEPKPDARPVAKSAAKAEPKADSGAESGAKAEPKAPTEIPPAQTSDGAPGFSVQLAAFSDDKGALSLANRLKRAGYPAYTEPLKTSRGTLWRVRVGPYPTRDAANGVRDKLKTEGQNGIVASSR